MELSRTGSTPKSLKYFLKGQMLNIDHKKLLLFVFMAQNMMPALYSV